MESLNTISNTNAIEDKYLDNNDQAEKGLALGPISFDTTKDSFNSEYSLDNNKNSSFRG